MHPFTKPLCTPEAFSVRTQASHPSNAVFAMGRKQFRVRTHPLRRQLRVVGMLPSPISSICASMKLAMSAQAVLPGELAVRGNRGERWLYANLAKPLFARF
jgi:hypothetical protein